MNVVALGFLASKNHADLKSEWLRKVRTGTGGSLQHFGERLFQHPTR